MTTKLPPAPFHTPMYQNGQMAPVWWDWFQNLYTRVGASVAVDPEGLEIFQAFSDLPQERDIGNQIEQAIAVFEQSGDNAATREAIQELRTLIASIQEGQQRQNTPKPPPPPAADSGYYINSPPTLTILQRIAALEELVAYQQMPTQQHVGYVDAMYADESHDHGISGIKGLQNALDTAAAAQNNSPRLPILAISGLQNTLDGIMAQLTDIRVTVPPNVKNTLAGYDARGRFSDVTIGTNLTLSGGVLNATGGGGGSNSDYNNMFLLMGG